MRGVYVGYAGSDKVYILVGESELSPVALELLCSLLNLTAYEKVNDDQHTLGLDKEYVVCGPRIGTSSPSSSNLVAAYNAMSHTNGEITIIESYTIVSDIDVEHDCMTQGVYPLNTLVASYFVTGSFNPDPELLENITLHGITYIAFDIDLLEKLNQMHGLALTPGQIQYFYSIFTSEKYNRTPTLSELYLFAQLNSEHCRHNTFNGRMIIDDEIYESSLFELIKQTYKEHPGDVIIAYADNGAILKGADNQYIVIKAETHNHPCLIAPFPGGATGSGGCYRDIMATGRGSMVEISTSTYCVGNVTSPVPYRNGHKTPEVILQEASRGVNDYGNCFAAPLINGSTLAVLEDLYLGDEVFAHAKPVVMAGSAGWTFVGAVDKQKEPGLLHIKLGGPDYAIGIGGAAASSMNSGQNTHELDFASVQRANPQMQIKVKKVLETIMHECPDAIRNIHDYGAGGHGTNIFELYEGDASYVGGGEVDIAKISVEDATMTYHQILINESQERLGMLIHPDYLQRISDICKREKCPFDLLGKATGSGIVRMYDSRTGKDIVHVAVEDMLVRDRMEFVDASPRRKLTPADTSSILAIDLLEILKHPTVGSKGYIVHHVDRSVRGNIVQQQTIGARQFPLADYGLFKTSPLHERGTVTAQGMKPYHSLIDPAIMSQRALAETILNLSFVKSKGLEALSLSGNWMRSAKHAGGKADLYKAVESLSVCCKGLGVNIPVGKDSMSMKVTTDDGVDVNAPGTLVLSGFLHVPDVTKKVTPELQLEESSLLWFPCASDHIKEKLYAGLHGSIIGLLSSQFGDTLPRVEMKDVRFLYVLVQELLEKDLLLAGHDISDGGLWACIVEMYIASEVDALDIHIGGEVKRRDTNFSHDDKTVKKLLASEYPGVVLQVKGTDCTSLLEYIEITYGLSGQLLGEIAFSGNPTNDTKEELSITWGGTSTRGSKSVWEKQQLIDAWCSYNTKLAGTDAETQFTLPTFASHSIKEMPLVGKTQPKVMVLRDEGTNGEHDMHTAFGLADFETIDVTITDLQEERIALESFQGLVIPGGFSYGDRPRSGKSFAEIIRHNPLLSSQFESFRATGNFVLGVCNGNQVLMELGWITDSYGLPILPMQHNDSACFESRFLALEVIDTNNRFFTGMEGCKLPVWVAHGEGKYAEMLSKEDVRVAARYIDSQGQATQDYPYNPNGSSGALAGVLSKDGNILGMMPHPERTILPHQMAYIPQGIDPETLSWMPMFKNLRRSV